MPSTNRPSALIRFDLSLENYFSYLPAPIVSTKPMIPRGDSPQSLFIRGEYGHKPNGDMRPVPAHNTTHLDVPFHFDAEGDDLAAVLNRGDSPADRPTLARVVTLGGDAGRAGAFTRNGVTYCERVDADDLPSLEELRGYEALVILTGFGEVMAQQEGPFTHAEDGYYHVPWLSDDATERILAAGLALVAIDSTTVEEQTSSSPHRMRGDVHLSLLCHNPPVLIMECLNGTGFVEKVGFVPSEGIFHMIPRRVNAAGAEAAHSRAFLYFYREDADGTSLRTLLHTMTPEEYHG